MKGKAFLIYLFKFVLTFCILYYGTIAMIGITSPGGYYWPFAHQYLDYVSALRWLLLHSSKALLQAFGYPVFLKDIYTIKLQNGLGVHIGYDCIGYGVLIFWFAFIFANKGSFTKKAIWSLGGLLLIWLVNVIRITLMVISVNQKWFFPFNINNHTWFNIAAYSVIFTMIFLFDVAEKKEVLRNEAKTDNYNID